MLKAMSDAPRRLPRITNPLSIPVEGVDDHLPPVSPALLAPSGLRARFAAPPAWQPETEGDGKAFLDREPAHASVLVPLVMREGGLTVLLTRRTEHLRDHAGQISFPGGRAEAHDDDAVATALREAEEEVGLSHSFVEVIGRLPHYTTVTRFVVTPVVALVRPGFSLRPDPSEVAEAFEVPLSFLMTPAHHRRHSVVVDGHLRRFLSMPWTGPDAAGQPRDYFIWGATAAMLRNFYRFLSA
ncbi:NTP pyrophosphohydrolase [Burkholderiales bacterium JOSHI_001]|nr:NTP pyrophosphohydrolase [Burkholderiales bacterium JOSHI_001]